MKFKSAVFVVGYASVVQHVKTFPDIEKAKKYILKNPIEYKYIILPEIT